MEDTTEPAGLDKGAIMDGDFVYEERYSSKSDNAVPELPISEGITVISKSILTLCVQGNYFAHSYVYTL